MACFIVPAAEAVVTTIVTKSMKSKEKDSAESRDGSFRTEGEIPFSRKLKWLSNMLWGGSALLAFEHVWHGEVIPFFPFLTAAGNPAETAKMLYEMVTVGVSMSAGVTAVWCGMLIAVKAMEKKTLKLPEKRLAAGLRQ